MKNNAEILNEIIEAFYNEEWPEYFQEAVGDIFEEEGITAAYRAVDAESVKHGRWKVLASGNDAICTNCEHYWIPNGDQYDYHYCPHCGAKMDL